MIDLNKPLDLKSIDINAIFGDLLKQKLVLAKVIAVVIAVAIAGSITVNFFRMKAEADERMLKLQEKLDMINSYKSSKQAFDAFINSLPRNYGEGEFVNAIADFAAKANVDIQTFSPITVSSSTYVDMALLQLNVTGKSFKDLVNFMRSMEESKYSLRINTFSFDSSSDSQISLALTVATVKTNKK